MLQGTVDIREPEEIRFPLSNRGWIVAKMDAGDFCFTTGIGQQVLVERKTIKQLLADLESGTLADQCIRLIAATEWPILLIEGQWVHMSGKLYRSSWTWEQAWNALQTYQDQKLRIQITTSIHHTVTRVQQLAEYYRKGIHVSIRRQSPGDHKLDVLTRIKGVGPAKAQKLIDTYGSLAHIATASPDALAMVPGVSYNLALEIWRWWHSKDENKTSHMDNMPILSGESHTGIQEESDILEV